MAIDPRVHDDADPEADELESDLDGVDPDEDQEAEDEDSGDDEGADAEADAEDGGDAEGDADAAAREQTRQVRLPRSQSRYQRLANENRELKARQAQFERQLQEAINQRREPTAAEIAAEQQREAEAVSMMAPHEVAAYYARKTENTINARLNQQERMLFDRADKAEYDGLLRDTPTYRRYEEKVEELRALAPNVSRKILLATAIGMRAMDGGGAARTRATRTAAANGERQRARPSNARGDVRSERGRSGGSLEDRLRDAQI